MDAGAGGAELIDGGLADAVGAAEDDGNLSCQVFQRGFAGGQLALAQLEEFVKQVGILFVCELHVALFASYEVDGHFGHVFYDDAAVVRHAQGGVAQGPLIGFLDDAEPEGLWRLSALQAGAVGDGGYVVAFGLHDGVYRGQGYVYRLVADQGGGYVVNDALADEGAHRVVEDEVHVAPGVGPYGREARVVALFAALEDALHFAPAVAQHHVFHVGHVEGVGDDGDFVDVRVAFEGVDGMFDDHLPGYLEKLFRCAQAEAATHAAGQDYGYIGSHGVWNFSDLNSAFR